MSGLTQFDGKGEDHMVAVSEKTPTHGIAVAEGCVTMHADTFKLLQSRDVKKGDVLSVARLAGIMGAKRCPNLIPLCHPLSITKVSVELEPNANTASVTIRATVKTTGQTGVEMESLTAARLAIGNAK